MSNHAPLNSNHLKGLSASHLQKHCLEALPNDFEPTNEEKAVLELYEIVRNTERIADRLKEEAARNKLNAKNEEFNKLKESKTKTKKQKRKKVAAKKPASADSMDSPQSNDSDDDDINDPETDEENPNSSDDDDVYERNEARLEKLRDEVENAKLQQKLQNDTKEDELRAEHLATTTDIASGPSIRRKRDFDVASEPTSSLIANLTATVTPPHDFSRSLEFNDDNGSIIFPVNKDEFSWSPPEGVFSPNDGAFVAELDGFDVSRAQDGNNTLAIKFMAPTDSRRFSINIAGPENNNFESVLFHFNPRQREKGGQLVINDKQGGTWGQALAVPLSQIPLMFGQTSCTLVIQVTDDGFDIFLEGKHCARLEHRTEFPFGEQNLLLQFPSTDDSGRPESWVVYKVWWGNRPIMATSDVSGVAGVNTYNALHPRKLFISGLPKIFKEADVDFRRAELERAFQKFGGALGARVIVPTKSTFAFVEFESERQADLALNEMSKQYRLNRARRSRHEALQEERAAKEAAQKAGGNKQSSEWN